MIGDRWAEYLNVLDVLKAPSTVVVKRGEQLWLQWYVSELSVEVTLSPPEVEQPPVSLVVRELLKDEPMAALEGRASPEVLKELLDAYVPTVGAGGWIDIVAALPDVPHNSKLSLTW